MTRTFRRMVAGLGATGTLLLPLMALAADEKPKIDSGDTAWMLTSTALVLMMTIPGLALFYGGMVRKKNVLTTVMQSFAITCLVTILWLVIGYSLAFTPGNAAIGGMGKMFLKGMTVDSINDLAKTIPESVYMMFQLTFAIITPALIAGAFAERMKFSALMWFMALWSLLVYAPIAHWVWGGGFLGDWGVLDFAGGTVVHINAGVAGLVCCAGAGQAQGLRHREHGAAQPRAQRHRRLAAVGRLVRLQRRLRRRRQWQRRHGDGGDADSPPPLRRSPGCSRSGSRAASPRCSASSPAPSPAWSPSRRPRASSTRWARSSSASPPA